MVVPKNAQENVAPPGYPTVTRIRSINRSHLGLSNCTIYLHIILVLN